MVSTDNGKLFQPKKIGVHAALNANWVKNALSAFVRCLVLFDCQISYKLIPIKVYRVIHTGPKTAPGGLNVGFTRLSNHSPLVNPVPRIPAR